MVLRRRPIGKHSDLRTITRSAVGPVQQSAGVFRHSRLREQYAAGGTVYGHSNDDDVDARAPTQIEFMRRVNSSILGHIITLPAPVRRFIFSSYFYLFRFLVFPAPSARSPSIDQCNVVRILISNLH